MTLIERYEEARKKADSLSDQWRVDRKVLKGNAHTIKKMEVAHSLREANELAIQLSSLFASNASNHFDQLFEALA